MKHSYALELNGKIVGRLLAFRTDVFHTPDVFLAGMGGPTSTARAPRFIQIDCASGMASGFYDWISTTRYTNAKGAILILASSGKTAARYEFDYAVVETVTVHNLGVKENTDGYIRVSFRASWVKYLPKEETVNLGAYAKPARAWRANRYRLEIEGLPDCKYVTRIDPVDMRTTLKVYSAGNSNSSDFTPTKTEFSSLTVELPKIHARNFIAWHEATLTAGVRQVREKDGAIHILTDNMAGELFVMKLSGLGISALSQKGTTTVVEMYCAGCSLQLHST